MRTVDFSTPPSTWGECPMQTNPWWISYGAHMWFCPLALKGELLGLPAESEL